MIRHALIINFDGLPLIVLQNQPFKDTKEQLDEYARDYAFEREKLTATVTQVMGFDEVEDLMAMLPRETAIGYYAIRKLTNPNAKGLLQWTVVFTSDREENDNKVLAHTVGATAAEAVRNMLTKLGITHSHIQPGTSTKYTG